MNVYILTEITKRELVSNLLLACIAADSNIDVIISNSETIKFLNDKKLLRKGLFHTKSLVHGIKKKKLHESLKKNNIKISSIDEEAGLILNDLVPFCKARFTDEDLEDADRIFCWGKNDYTTLNSLFDNSKNKLVLSGSHRFDMMREEFNDYWNFSACEKKYITVSGNFNLVNGFIQKSKLISDLERQGYFLRSEEYKKEVMNAFNDMEKKFPKFIEMLNIIINRFPNENFYLRPHPLEKIETWYNLFSKFKNVKISKDGNINEQLVNSKLLIHNSCTSAFHSFFYKIPTISYEPVECTSDYGEPANRLSERVKNVEDLCDLIHKMIKSKYKSSNKEHKNNLFNYKVYKPSSKYSSEIIVDEWKKVLNVSSNEKLDLKKIKKELFKKTLINNLKRMILKLSKPFKPLYQDKKFEDLNEKTVSEKIKKIQKILKLSSKLSVNKISNRCFFIKKI